MSTKVNIKTVVDSKRGCGWRKPGGIYLRCDGISRACGKLPVPLGICPCCHAGIKPARGWTWIDIRPFTEPVKCALEGEAACASCVLSHPPAQVGLLWIGEKYYPKPSDWIEEAHKLGVSRRISAVPKDFEVGTTWVFAAHRKAIPGFDESKCTCHCPDGKGQHLAGCEGYIATPGIFHVFRPDRIEYVTTGKESEEELAALAKRGLTLVKVQRDTDLPGMDSGSKK